MKLGSPGYRFLLYYTGDPVYRRAGPPQMLLRLDAPIVIVSTGLVILSGVELWIFGNSRAWLTLHQGSFINWFFATALHVFGYLERAPRLAFTDLTERPPLRGAFARQGVVVGSLIGLVLAIVLVLSWTTPFLLRFEG
ncbi:MAG: hypothetical protein ABI401_15535 [Candidatus Dormibacter sp.]